MSDLQTTTSSIQPSILTAILTAILTSILAPIHPFDHPSIHPTIQPSMHAYLHAGTRACRPREWRRTHAWTRLHGHARHVCGGVRANSRMHASMQTVLLLLVEAHVRMLACAPDHVRAHKHTHACMDMYTSLCGVCVSLQ